ncbi:MAG: sulfurtransferase TusA family protein [Bauldia sp.]|nr:sulfurtransferase TusA family protein [Bauldia sp.]
MPDRWDHDRMLDTRGLACPLPVLKARKALEALPPGARLLVEATDPLAALDIPHFCGQAGHALSAVEARNGVHRFVITKKGAAPTAST